MSTWGLSVAALAGAGIVSCTEITRQSEAFLYYGEGGTGGGGVGGGDGGTAGGPPVDCVPSGNTNPVANSCGVFVSPTGDDNNAGTKEQPLKTLKAALAKGATIYACAGATPFTEAVKISKSTTLFGALDCVSWVHDASKKTQLTADPDAVPLTIASGDSDVYDLAITSANATQAGGSSIAVLVNGTGANFFRCDLTAGDGQQGLKGMDGGAQAPQADPGLSGMKADVVGTLSDGGKGSENKVCGLIGGDGGGGGPLPTGNGSDGAAGDIGSGGLAGVGDTGTGCSGDPNGPNGGGGPFGPGASGIGILDGSGYHGIDGVAGTDGFHGKSGGGGGGSKAVTPLHGAGGGGGGAGGCGGKGGTNGKAGGSSIALVSVNATVMMTSCTLKSGLGANGGAGGSGQPGQFGGDPGPKGPGSGTVSPACAGGSGGKGGNGGNGGGGLGGHSLAIAATGTPPMLDAMTKDALGVSTQGKGGDGGNVNASANAGANGMAKPCWSFDAKQSCG